MIRVHRPGRDGTPFTQTIDLRMPFRRRYVVMRKGYWQNPAWVKSPKDLLENPPQRCHKTLCKPAMKKQARFRALGPLDPPPCNQAHRRIACCPPTSTALSAFPLSQQHDKIKGNLVIGGIELESHLDPLAFARLQRRKEVPEEFRLDIATSLKATLAAGRPPDIDVQNITATEDDTGGARRRRRLAEQLYKLDVEYTAGFASTEQAATCIERFYDAENSKLLNDELLAELLTTESFEDQVRFGETTITTKLGTPRIDNKAVDMSADPSLREGWVKCKTGHTGPMCKICEMPEYVPSIGGLCVKCTAGSGTAAWILLVLLVAIPGVHYAVPAVQRYLEAKVAQDESKKAAMTTQSTTTST